ncbi:hypothetical protein [Buttiauxella noackiae]|uniref:hypothetical protein n=1 Tax=Buttiauxella noackiae TaxID=82992 RepID=UPI0028D35FEB|nr:hypothetical protein [Buttiauxella noackiae]
MSDKITIELPHLPDDIIESSGFVETAADGVVTIGTNNNGFDVMTMVFLNSSPVIGHKDGEIIVHGMQRKRVASITLSKEKAFDFYKSLKSIFEE